MRTRPNSAAGHFVNELRSSGSIGWCPCCELPTRQVPWRRAIRRPLPAKPRA